MANLQQVQKFTSAVESFTSKIDSLCQPLQSLGQHLMLCQGSYLAAGMQSRAWGMGFSHPCSVPEGGLDTNSELLRQAMECLAGQKESLDEQRKLEATLQQLIVEEGAWKNNMLQELLDAIRNLNSPARSPSQGVDACKPPRYRSRIGTNGRLYEFPEVEVSVKVYQICNVNTAQLTFEVDFLCRLDWRDPNVVGLGPEELAKLDWSQYYNPHLEVDNCKDNCGWLDGMDSIPRRRSASSEPRVEDRCTDLGPSLRKTMRFRGTLAMGPVDLRCFPFDRQALPIRLKSRRCRGLALATPMAGAQEQSGRVSLVESRAMLKDERYWQNHPYLRGGGNYAVATAGDALLEFGICGLAGQHPCKTQADVYEVNIFIKRPFFASYFWDLVILNLLVMLAATAFWDTAAPELSSRMSISLTVILTLAAYTSSRPAPIEKAPYTTFHDWCEQMSMFLVTGISVQNVIAVVSCGGQHEEAPPYMAEEFKQNEESCRLGWCKSRSIDCSSLIVLLVTWFLLMIYSISWLVRLRRNAPNGLRERLASLRVVQKKEANVPFGGPAFDEGPWLDARDGFVHRRKPEAPSSKSFQKECASFRMPEGEGHAPDGSASDSDAHAAVEADASLAAAVAAAFEAGRREGSMEENDERRLRPQQLEHGLGSSQQSEESEKSDQNNAPVGQQPRSGWLPEWAKQAALRDIRPAHVCE